MSVSFFFTANCHAGWGKDKKNTPPISETKKPVERPSTFKCLENRPGFFVTADYLFWSFNEDQLQFATVSSEPLIYSGTATKLKIEDQDFDWNSGFRIGAGGRLPYDNWDLYLNWTYFDFTNDKKVNRPNEISPLGSTAVASTAKAKWHMNFETLDLELGKAFEISRFVVFRPHIGVEGALIDQKQTVTFGDLTGGGLFAPDYIRRKNNSLAIGPRIGLNTRWLVGAGIGIVGNISGSILYSKFDVNSKFSSSFGQNLLLKSNTHLIRPNVQIALGVDWAYCFNNKQVLLLGANYETQFWWGQWTSPTISTFNINGDLGSQGLTVKFRYDF